MTRNERSSVFLVEVIQAFMGTAICLLVYYTARHLFGDGSASIALIVSSAYPLLVYSPSQISAVSTYGLLAQVATLILLLVSNNRYEAGRKRLWFLGGIALGLLVLARAESLLFALLIIGWLCWDFRKRQLQNVVLLSLAMGIAICPWVIRNWYVFGRLSPLTTSGGYNFWQGQNESATGTLGGYVVPPVTESAELTRNLSEIRPSKTYELDRDKLYQEDALASIKSHPTRLFTLALRKVAYYWGGVYVGFNMSYPGAHSPLILVPWFCLLPFFVIGLLRSLRQYRNCMILYLMLISSTLVSMVFFVLPRYPIFVLPTVIIISSYGILWSLEVASKHVVANTAKGLGPSRKRRSKPVESSGCKSRTRKE